MANPTKQRKPSFGKGGVPTPPGFEAHPERRHNGAWKKEATARYKLEKMLVLTADELNDIAADDNAPLFERKLAKCISQGKWREFEGIMNQVYGTPKQTQETRIEAEATISGIDVTFRDESRADK